jgi:adhesin transport system membrane fusion protein
LSEASKQAGRTVISSPIDGVVKNLLISTIGGVVSPGQPIMEIVPSDRNLVVEAKLNPIDIGFVEEGQRAVVKLSTYDFVRYGGLEGVMIQVAPDPTVENKGDTYFRVVVATEKTYLGDVEGSLQIFPGMDATVDIKTGTKTVAEYLIRPVLKLRYEAFRER